jgi:DNA polymerase-4
VGEQTAARLERAGIRWVADLRAVDEATLTRMLGAAAAHKLQLTRVLLGLSERVGQRLRRSRVRARTVTLKLRHASFQTVTRARTLPVPTSQATEVYRVVAELLDDVWAEPTPVRLLGVGASRLIPEGQGVQMDMLGTTRWEAAERVADDVRAQFGEVALTRGALLGDARHPAAPSRDDLPGEESPS